MQQDAEQTAAAVEERSQAQRTAYQAGTAHASGSGRDAGPGVAMRHSWRAAAHVSCALSSMAWACTAWACKIHVLGAEEIRSYFMEHLQSKEDSAQAGAEAAPDPEDTAAQVARTLPLLPPASFSQL